jgi:hypothetical protein
VALLALDINDSEITLLGGDGVLYAEPGIALIDNESLTTGAAAMKWARVRPRQVQDRYWSELGVDALPDRRFRHLSAADLVSRQLEELWHAGGRSGHVVVAVPPYHDSGQLGLLLGICADLDIPVAGLVDAAVAATRREYRDAEPVHVDISLYATHLTRLAQPGRAQVERSEIVADAGVNALYNAWIRTVAETFVRQSRFDPLHTAETEQMLLDGLPGWLAAAATAEVIPLSIEHAGLTHEAEIESLSLVAAAAPVYQRIVAQLRALCRADETPALQLTDRVARLPGLADMLKARVGGELFLLERGATARGLIGRCRDFEPGVGQIALLRQLPWDQAAIDVRVDAKADAGGRPTHLLLDNHAWAINARPLNLGTQPSEDERWVALDQSMPGVSRKHCSVELDNGQCVLRDYSRYGTFLNGHRLEGSAVLQAGDSLRIGTPGFELRLITVKQNDGA